MVHLAFRHREPGTNSTARGERSRRGGRRHGGAFARRVDLGGVFVRIERQLACSGNVGHRSIVFCSRPRARAANRPDPRQRHLELASRLGADAGSRAENFEVARRELGQLRAEGVVHLGAARAPEGFATPLLTVVVQLAPVTAGGPARSLRFFIGKGDSSRETSVFFARREGVDATFAIAQGKSAPCSNCSSGC